jgi:hypothetical protein
LGFGEDFSFSMCTSPLNTWVLDYITLRRSPLSMCEKEEASVCRTRVNILVLMLLECRLCVIAEYQLVRGEILTLIRVYREMQLHLGGGERIVATTGSRRLLILFRDYDCANTEENKTCKKEKRNNRSSKSPSTSEQRSERDTTCFFFFFAKEREKTRYLSEDETDLKIISNLTDT